MDDGDELILQSPLRRFTTTMGEGAGRLAKKRGVKTTILIHDLPSLQSGSRSKLRDDITFLNSFDHMIHCAQHVKHSYWIRHFASNAQIIT